MPERDGMRVASLAERLRRGAGAAPPTIALMRLITEAATPAEAEAALDAAKAGADEARGAALSAIRELWRDNPQAWAVVKGVLADVEHDRPAPSAGEGVARVAAAFDRAARVSAEGSVALYSLGNPALLAAATGEVVARLREWGLLGPGRRVLDLGCGLGRIAGAIAGEVAEVVGIDVSAEMIAAARARCAGVPNLRFEPASGRDLAPFADSSFDLVLAVDSFPYIVGAGGDLAARHVAEAARVLSRGGDLVILNFSYRDDPAADRADAARLAKAHGFRLLRAGERPFRLWDGVVFHFIKSA